MAQKTLTDEKGLLYLVIIYFRRKEQPSVNLALPPVGWQRTVEQPAQTTTVWACEKTVVIVKQPGHLTSMKKERGAGTSVLSILVSYHTGSCSLIPTKGIP